MNFRAQISLIQFKFCVSSLAVNIISDILQRNRFFTPSQYTPLGQDKAFLAQILNKDIHLPKWDFMKFGQISEKIEKQVLADELQRMLRERNQDSDGALVVNKPAKLADSNWYEIFIYTLDPQHRFFNRVSDT